MSEPAAEALQRDYGQQWQIEREPGGLWVAIERPPLRFHVADNPAELRELLEADSDDE